MQKALNEPTDETSYWTERAACLPAAAAGVLWAVSLSPGPADADALARLSGRGLAAVRAALHLLAEQGLVQAGPGGSWRLSAGFRRHLAAAVHTGAAAPSDSASKGEGTAQLRELLAQMGIVGPTLAELAQRPELQAEPARAQAWWWYALTQRRIDNPAGLTVHQLRQGHDPPPGFLTLARLWPTLSSADRQELRQLAWRGWQAEEMAAAFTDRRPGLTAAACTAFRSLLRHAPDQFRR